MFFSKTGIRDVLHLLFSFLAKWSYFLSLIKTGITLLLSVTVLLRVNLSPHTVEGIAREAVDLSPGHL